MKQDACCELHLWLTGPTPEPSLRTSIREGTRMYPYRVLGAQLVIGQPAIVTTMPMQLGHWLLSMHCLDKFKQLNNLTNYIRYILITPHFLSTRDHRRPFQTSWKKESPPLLRRSRSPVISPNDLKLAATCLHQLCCLQRYTWQHQVGIHTINNLIDAWKGLKRDWKGITLTQLRRASIVSRA